MVLATASQVPPEKSSPDEQEEEETEEQQMEENDDDREEVEAEQQAEEEEEEEEPEQTPLPPHVGVLSQSLGLVGTDCLVVDRVFRNQRVYSRVYGTGGAGIPSPSSVDLFYVCFSTKIYTIEYCILFLCWLF